MLNKKGVKWIASLINENQPNINRNSTGILYNKSEFMQHKSQFPKLSRFLFRKIDQNFVRYKFQNEPFIKIRDKKYLRKLAFVSFQELEIPSSGRHEKSRMGKVICILIGLVIILTVGCKEEREDIGENNLELVTLNIEFEPPLPIANKTEMILHENSSTEHNIYEGNIKIRGGFSFSFPKHSYEIDLKEDVSLVNLPKDDDWILISSFIDKTFIRHVFSYELFLTMNDQNITSEYRYVELELNGDYSGLYILMEKLDKSSLEINGLDSSAFIFKEPHIFRETYDGIVPQYTNNFHQQTFPKIWEYDKRDYLEGVRDFILSSNSNQFEDVFSSFFDLNNILDWHLLLLISNNSDGILKNFYLYKKDSETPMKVAPWDYDHSFGRDGDNELNLDERPLNIESSILFKRLLQFDWYKLALKDRWMELNNMDILSKKGLVERVLMKSTKLREAVEKNFKVWLLDDDWYYDANNFDEEIEIMIKFIDLRHERLTKYFEQL